MKYLKSKEVVHRDSKNLKTVSSLLWKFDLRGLEKHS